MKMPKVTRSRVNVVAIVALALTASLAAFTAVEAWGEQKARVGAVEHRQEALDRDVRGLRGKIDNVAVGQSATQSTVEAIQKQQGIDRSHMDTRLSDIMRAIQQSRR